MSIISIGIPIPDRSALPGQSGSGEEVNLQYATQNYCAGTGIFTPTVATPAGGVFTDNSSDPNLFQVNSASGAFNLGVSDPGNYIVTYTVAGVGSANFPINIGAIIDTTITGDSATCIGFAPSPADLTAVSGYSNYEWFKDNVSVQNGASNTYTPAFNVAGSFVYKVTITDNSLGTPCTATSSNFAFTVNALPTISIAGTDFCAGQSTTLTATPSNGTFVWEVNTGSGYNVISGQTNNTISVNTAGDYRAKVTDANGCISDYSNVLAIAQFASPSVTIATVPGTTICTGDTATLTANPTGGSGPYTYLWSTSATGNSISVTTSGTYTVTVTDNNGCTATASQAITASTAATTIAAIDNNNTMTFNGTDQYIQLSNEVNHGTTNTLSFWINSSNTGTRDIFGANTNGGYLLKALNASNTVSYRTSAGARTFDLSGLSSNPMKDGDWHHIAFTRNSSNLIQLYVDGSPVGSAQSLTGNTLFEIIGANYGKTVFFDGKLDEVAVWNTALSSCDVKGIYDATTTVSGQPKSANLLDANTTIPTPVYWNRMGDS
jgi:hypothetical protein